MKSSVGIRSILSRYVRAIEAASAFTMRSVGTPETSAVPEGAWTARSIGTEFTALLLSVTVIVICSPAITLSGPETVTVSGALVFEVVPVGVTGAVVCGGGVCCGGIVAGCVGGDVGCAAGAWETEDSLHATAPTNAATRAAP